MGTYNCNWVAYSTQLYLDQKKLSTHNIFLHLPKDWMEYKLSMLPNIFVLGIQMHHVK